MSKTHSILITALAGSALNYAVSLCEKDNVAVEIRGGDVFFIDGHFSETG